MSGAQARLFHANNFSLDYQIETIDKLTATKYMCFHTSFGMGRGHAKGYVSYTALMTMVDYTGRCHVKSVEGTSLVDLIGKVFESLQTP